MVKNSKNSYKNKSKIKKVNGFNPSLFLQIQQLFL